MRKELRIIIVVALFAFAVPRFVAAQNVTTIVLPNGGECLTVGTAYTIQFSWSGSGVEHLALYYRTDGAQPTHLGSSLIKHPINVPQQGTSWNWTPTSDHISETGRIWVDGHAHSHSSLTTWDSSDADFSVRSSCEEDPPSPPPPAENVGGGETPGPTVRFLEIRETLATSATIYWSTGQYGYYKLSYGTSSGVYSKELETRPPDAGRGNHEVVLKNLQSDTTYYFQIITGHLQKPTKSQEYSFKTIDTTPPSHVGNVFGVAGSSTALIAWTNPTDPDFKETAIVGRRDRFAEHKTDGEIVFLGTESYYADAGLASDKSYYYSIFTVDDTGNISLPTNLMITTNVDYEEISRPPTSTISATTTIRVDSISSSAEEDSITLSWENPADQRFLGVQVVRNKEALPAHAYDGNVVFRGRSNSLNDFGIESETRYNYGIFAFDWENKFYTPSFTAEITKPPKSVLQALETQIGRAKLLIQKLVLAVRVVVGTRETEEAVTEILRLGSKGEEVENLQEILAQHPGLYPEGLVTGYFGPLTREAVRRFQEKYGIVFSGDEDTTGYGSVGLKTKEKLLLLSAGVLEEPKKITTEEKPQQKIYKVSILPDRFSPQTVIIRVGDTVRWTNESGGLAWVATDVHPTHTTYPNSNIEKCETGEARELFDACDVIDPGNEWLFTFNEVGIWQYHGHIDPFKKGTVIVKINE